LHIVRTVRVAFLLASALASGYGGEDHLVPLQPESGLLLKYERVWKKKLLVTPADVARFVFLPGTVGGEGAVSVYTHNREHAPGDNSRLTVTQPTVRLWDCMPQFGESPSHDLRSVKIERCDLPLPDSTATALHRVWLAMLTRARPEPKSDAIILDSSSEIYSAVDGHGRTLWGKAPSEMKTASKTFELFAIANQLIDYCNVPESRRAAAAADIQKSAERLLAKLKRSNQSMQPTALPRTASPRDD
jgi:hypothetical protein